MPSLRHTQQIPSVPLHSGEFDKKLPNMSAQYNDSSIDFSIYSALLQAALQFSHTFFDKPHNSSPEGVKENLRSSAEMLQQGIIKYGSVLSEDENIQIPNYETDIKSVNNITIIKDDYTKSTIINSLKNFLIETHQLTEAQGEDFETSLIEKVANHPIYIASVEIEEEKPLSRKKRISLEEHEKRIADHITENCAFEPEILRAEIVDEGELFILKAQRALNPFRMAYDNTPNHEPLPIDNFLHTVADGANNFYNIITIGMKPFFSELIANYYRKKYYDLKNDEICSSRQAHLNLAEVATFIDVGGLPFTRRGGKRFKAPKELNNSKSLPDRAAYISRNKGTDVFQELIFKVKSNNKVQEAIIDNGRDILLIKKTENGEFVTYHPYATHPDRLERRVIKDEETNIWRYADSFNAEQLNVEIMEGKKFIKLYGNNYELQMNSAQQYVIVAEQTSGIKNYIPVYMEPLSKAWHLKTHNEKAVFSNKQIQIINNLKVLPEQDKSYFANNLSGVIFEVRDSGELVYTNHVLYSVVEMNGNIVPVKLDVIPGHGVKYHIYNIKNASDKIHSIEWDGNRWIFDKPTSTHVSKELRKSFKSDVHEKIDMGQLSSPDHQGLRWDKASNSYLKINNNFFKIKKQRDNENRFYIRTDQGRYNLRFKNGQFHSETIAERLKNIQEVGLSGTNHRTAESILIEQAGFSPKKAKKLLKQYDFPKTGVFSSDSFALSFEQHGSSPAWAARFKKGTLDFLFKKPVYTVEKIKEKLGDRIGSGASGHVYLDKDNSNYVIKKIALEDDHFFLSHDGDAAAEYVSISAKESELFRQYYGEESSKVYVDTNGDCYNRMYRIPGKILRLVPENSLPPDAVERYVDMIETLNHVDIMHGDLHAGNILWDQETSTFYPIDISNHKEAFFKGSKSFKDTENAIDRRTWNSIINQITSKIKV